MKNERPILFSAPMVRAILAGEKTQTRCVIRIDDTPIVNAKLGRLQRGIPTNAVNVRHLGCYLKCDAAPGSDTVSARVSCPYGERGDRLWVRETWAVDRDLDDVRRAREDLCAGPVPGLDGGPYYRADGVHENTGLKWRPSIFLPRWACRLSLEVTSVRVERVQSISEADARAEGCPLPGTQCRYVGDRCNSGRCPAHHPRAAYAALWDTINGKRPGCSWDANPWVWAIEFRRSA